MTKAKHAGGRPTLYRREMCDRLVEAMAKGLSVEAAAARIGISARSLFYWQQQHPEFLQAIQEGRQKSQLWWEERALAMASGDAGNTQIVMLGLRNRSRAATGWNNDTVKLEHTGPEGGVLEVKVKDEHKIDIASLEPEQRDQLREILLAAKALATKAV
jgi:transposase-like protein